MSNSFEKLNSVDLDPGIRVEKYRSRRTGLTVCIADVPGPIVNGFFCLATEAHDDDGLPHTLEHLVFLGSEKYPYKGVLDLLANRCFARGTNAWTDVDYTCYTLTTAGSEGFLQILPVYLDHILYPTLTDEGYVTEVHHITGKGEDAGVVYCEMQARENTMGDLTSRAMLRSMYPGHCGYQSETGGMLSNLRESTSNEKVRNFHKAFYRPENLCIVVTGNVDAQSVFTTLQPFEDRIVSKGERAPFQRPWQSPVPPLESSTTLRVPFPSDDVSSGLVTLSWRGPNVSEQATLVALQSLWEYLTDSPVSPLQRELVEIDDPVCSSLGFSMMENMETCLMVSAENVPAEQLGEIQGLVMNVLQGIASGFEELDMTRLSSLMDRDCKDVLDKLEDSPHNTIADNFIGDFLYSQTTQDYMTRMDRVATLKRLMVESAPFWRGLLKKYIIGTPCILVVGEPSADLGAQLADGEQKRIAEQCTALGETRIGELDMVLEAAKKKNDVEAPESMLSSLSIPSISSISFHSVSTFSNNPQRSSASQISANCTLEGLPIAFEVNDIKTSFVEVNAILNTAGLCDEQRLYLPLYLEVLFESPVLRAGKLINYERVVTEMEADLLDQGAALGFYCSSVFRAGSFGELVVVSLKTDIARYHLSVKWLQEILYAVQFTKSRVRSVAKKLKKEITEKMRSGGKVVNVIARHLNFGSRANQINTSMIRQQAFLKSLLDRLDSDSAGVCKDFDDLRLNLARADNVVLRVVTNMAKLSETYPDPLAPWQQFFSAANCQPSAQLVLPPPVQRSAAFVRPFDSPVIAGEALSQRNIILGLKSEESSYLVQSCPGISSYEDSDAIALQVFIEYMVAMEGPMWRLLRGAGLSYDYNVSNETEAGLLYFCLSKCTNMVEAYKEGKKILLSYAEGSAQFEQVKVESAISSVVFAIIQNEESCFDAAEQAFINTYRQVPADFQRQKLQKVICISNDDLQRVAAKYLQRLFDPQTSRCVVCCNTSKVDEISSGLSEHGLHLTTVPSISQFKF